MKVAFRFMNWASAMGFLCLSSRDACMNTAFDDARKASKNKKNGDASRLSSENNRRRLRMLQAVVVKSAWIRLSIKLKHCNNKDACNRLKNKSMNGCKSEGFPRFLNRLLAPITATWEPRPSPWKSLGVTGTGTDSMPHVC